MKPVRILGGGPAGSSAAIAALREGSTVAIIERAKFPRHKVCGEFLSPAIARALDNLGLSLCDRKPAQIRRMRICIGSADKSANLAESAYGLSRYRFDHWLWQSALQMGATSVGHGAADIITTGRFARAPKGGRLFGFKAHFTGPSDNAVELFFRGKAYVGINCIEDGITNVCGIAPEEDIRDIDLWLHRDPALRERVAPLTRSWDWIFTGPLTFGRQLVSTDGAFLAGDALNFVDPFTGSGLLCAILTGSLAGQSAARGVSPDEYNRRCGRLLANPYGISSFLRKMAATRLAPSMLRLSPASLLFKYTRPA